MNAESMNSFLPIEGLHAGQKLIFGFSSEDWEDEPRVFLFNRYDDVDFEWPSDYIPSLTEIAEVSRRFL